MTTDANTGSLRATPLAVISRISVEAAKAALTDGTELAFLDLRDEVDYARGHILYAAHLPLSRLDLQIRNLVPRLDTRIVLTDGGERLAEEAAGILLEAGYTDVRLLHGGNDGWNWHGYPLYTGRNVPGIGFFEVVEHRLGTPNISATDLKDRLDRGDDIVILDTRPREEFENFHIPGAVNAPGVEILHRLEALEIGPETLVVANCAGRTRSIMGAQTLINAGVTNPVASLTGGTMEWLIAGLALERGPGETAPPPRGAALARTRDLAEALADKLDIRRIDAAGLARLEADTRRTLYKFDVRTPEEYVAGHLPGFRSAQGGQLASGTERFAPVRGARLVLHDPDGVRDLVTASWIAQLGGYEVYVLRVPAGGELEAGPEPRRFIAPRAPAAPSLSAEALLVLVEAGRVRVVDVSGANAYRKLHIPGAVHSARKDAEAVAGTDTPIVVTSEDGVLASVVAAELARRPTADVRWLLGGNGAWKAAGLPTDKGGIPDEAGDDIPDRYALPPARRDALFHQYLAWEVSLVELLEADPDARAKFDIRAVAP